MIQTEKTSCDTCCHQNVCILKEQFKKAQEVAQHIVIDKIDGAEVLLSSKPFIAPIRLRCLEYESKRIYREDRKRG